jgi:hypothetical protein
MLRSHHPELAARVVVDAQGSLSIRNCSVSAYAHDSEHRYGGFAAARHSNASQYSSDAESSAQQVQRRSSKRHSSSRKQRAETAELPHRLHVSARRRSTRTGEHIAHCS